MAKALNITPAVSSLLGSLFFLGYFFFQVPGAHYTANKSAKKLIFWSLILWGALATATGLVNDVGLLMVIRFMLGVVQSAVMPAMLVLLTRWFTKAEWCLRAFVATENSPHSRCIPHKSWREVEAWVRAAGPCACYTFSRFTIVRICKSF